MTTTTPIVSSATYILFCDTDSQFSRMHVDICRTFSNHIITEIARCVEFCHMSSGWFDHTEPSLSCAGCLCTSSGWFKHIEPRRTFPNHIITEIARCVEFCHMSSGWFDYTEPSLSGVQGAYVLVRGVSSTSNLPEPHHYRDSKVCKLLSHEFGVVRPYRTFSIYIVTGETRGAYALVRGGSSTSNLVKPSQTTSLQR